MTSHESGTTVVVVIVVAVTCVLLAGSECLDQTFSIASDPIRSGIFSRYRANMQSEYRIWTPLTITYSAHICGNEACHHV